MFNWINGSKEIKAEVNPVVDPSPVIGEPVLSIIEAMKDVSAWTLSKSYGIYEIKHTGNQLVLYFWVDFQRRHSSGTDGPHVEVCRAEWATKDEQKAMSESFKYFVNESMRIEKEYRHMELQIEREKFMVFVKEKK